jgi:AraC-like DNA-binding protein/CheY-like chemotaxis protein
MIRPKILIVEDELLIAKDISIILEKEGYETVIGVTTVEEAISKIENEEFKLVLIDINLSNNSDGVDLGIYLLKKDTLPFIYITSHSDNVTIDRIKDTRPHGIIIKPFKSIDIKSTVSVVLSNYKHKYIDVLRNDNEMEVDEVPYILKNVIEYINTNIDKKLEIQELSNLTKWSHHHFIKTFTKYVNQTPYQYILKKKMDKAKAIISESDISLTDIASDLGFSSYSNFCNAFKKETGKTPDIFRKLYYMNNQIK